VCVCTHAIYNTYSVCIQESDRFMLLFNLFSRVILDEQSSPNKDLWRELEVSWADGPDKHLNGN